MRKIMLTVLSLCIVLTASCQTPEQEQVEIYQVNNIQVVHVYDTSTEWVAFNFSYLYLKNHSEFPAGIDKLLINTLINGDTQKYSAEKIRRLKEENQIRLSSAITGDYAGITLSCFSKDFKVSVDLLEQLVFNNKISESVFINAKNYQSTVVPDQYELIMAEVKQKYFKEHEYSMLALGTPEEIQKIDIELFRKYYVENVLNGRIKLVIYGDVTKSEVTRLLTRIKYGGSEKELHSVRLFAPDKGNRVHFIKDEEKGVVCFTSFHASCEQELVNMFIIGDLLEKRMNDVLRKELSLSYLNDVQLETGAVNCMTIRVVSENPELVIEKLKTLFLSGELFRRETDMSQEERVVNELCLKLRDPLNYARFLSDAALLGYDTRRQIECISKGNFFDEKISENILKELWDNMFCFYLGGYAENERNTLISAFAG